MRRRSVLSGLLAAPGWPAAAQKARRAAAEGMDLTFDYVAARDGLALLEGGPTRPGYAADRAAHPARCWQPRFSTETDPKGSGNYWNGEHQFYTDPEYKWSNRHSPFAIVDATLRIRAERVAEAGFQPGEVPTDAWTGASYRWVSGVLTSRSSFSQQGGYFEVDAMVPKGTGTWPAFWLLPVDEDHPPELDVMEFLGHEPTSYRATVISLGPVLHGTTVPAPADLSLDFHRYGMMWSDTAITFYLDEAVVATQPIAGRREFWQPFYLLLNLAIGSRIPRWVPPPDASTPSPSDLLIRSVRAWQIPGPR